MEEENRDHIPLMQQTLFNISQADSRSYSAISEALYDWGNTLTLCRGIVSIVIMSGGGVISQNMNLLNDLATKLSYLDNEMKSILLNVSGINIVPPNEETA